MAEIKTKLNQTSVATFVESITDQDKKRDSKEILKLLRRVTGKKPEMWGSSIVGFGRYTYTGSDKKTNAWMAIGFSPRKENLTLYIMPGYSFDAMKALLMKLGKHKTGKSCLYIKKLEDIDMKILERIVKTGYKMIASKHINYGKDK